MIQKNKQDKEKGRVNPVLAAVTGAIVGAGFAVAGAVAMKDKKNREKVKKVLNMVKDQAMEYIEDIQNTTEGKKDEVEGKLAEGKRELKERASVAKDTKKAAHTK